MVLIVEAHLVSQCAFEGFNLNKSMHVPSSPDPEVTGCSTRPLNPLSFTDTTSFDKAKEVGGCIRYSTSMIEPRVKSANARAFTTIKISLKASTSSAGASSA